MENKRAQISETTTWIVATVIIVIILLVSVFLASLVGQNKKFPAENKFDLFTHKSLTSYLLTKDTSGQAVYNEINNDGNFNDFNGNLAKKIFVNLYSGYYGRAIFLGIEINTNSLFGYLQSNQYFNVPAGKTPGSFTAADPFGSEIRVQDSINLDNNKTLQLTLIHGL